MDQGWTTLTNLVEKQPLLHEYASWWCHLHIKADPNGCCGCGYLLRHTTKLVRSVELACEAESLDDNEDWSSDNLPTVVQVEGILLRLERQSGDDVHYNCRLAQIRVCSDHWHGTSSGWSCSSATVTVKSENIVS